MAPPSPHPRSCRIDRYKALCEDVVGADVEDFGARKERAQSRQPKKKKGFISTILRVKVRVPQTGQGSGPN